MSDYFFLILNRDTMNQIVSNNLFPTIVELKKSYIGYNMGGLANYAFALRLLPFFNLRVNFYYFGNFLIRKTKYA